MNTQISITTNGRTTLATAGKYCDRNIDILTNMPFDEADLAEQKGITNSIIDRTIAGAYGNDQVTQIAAYAFHSCTLLEKVVFTKATRVDSTAFGNCTSLEVADFSSIDGNSGIRGNAFKSCEKLATLILRNPKVARLVATTAFDGTPIASGTGYVYVPKNLVDSYKTATNWSTYADQIRAIEDYFPTVEGTWRIQNTVNGEYGMAMEEVSFIIHGYNTEYNIDSEFVCYAIEYGGIPISYYSAEVGLLIGSDKFSVCIGAVDGWQTDEYGEDIQTITFTEEQDVSKKFYDWLIENAVKVEE